MTTRSTTAEPKASAGGAQDSPQRRQIGAAASEELRTAVRAALGDHFNVFLNRLPDALTRRRDHTDSAHEQEACDSLLASLPKESETWVQTLVLQVDAQLIGGTATSASDVEGLESFALADMELRAEERYEDLVRKIDTKLDRIRQTVYFPIFGKAIAPAGLCRALQDTADKLEWAGIPRRLLFDKFDDLFIGQLTEMYKALLASIERIGSATERAVQSPSPAPTPPPAAKPAAPPKSATATRVPSPPPARPDAPARPNLKLVANKAAPAKAAPRKETYEVDNATRSTLEQFAANEGGDGLLARELLTLASDAPLRGQPRDPRFAPLQRLTLAGDFLTESTDDPLVPDSFRDQHEAMRFPLVKSALADETFFTAVTHPLRSLVNDLMMRSAKSRVTGSVEASRIADMLQQVLAQFDLAPEFVKEAMASAKPIGQAEIHRFREMQRAEMQKRRETILSEAKRQVIHEIEQCTFGRAVPPPTVTFLNRRWGPMLVRRLIKFGPGHDQWTSAIVLMDRMVDLLEARAPGSAPTAAWQQVKEQMARALIVSGMAAEPADSAVAGLDLAWTSN